MVLLKVHLFAIPMGSHGLHWSLCLLKNYLLLIKNDYHHHKHPGLGHLTSSVSRVTAALSIASSVSQLFSFLVGCRCVISRGFCFVAFFVCVLASSFCIHLSCLVCSPSVVRGIFLTSIQNLRLILKLTPACSSRIM